jgi:predicted nucleic acid-binding protein
VSSPRYLVDSSVVARWSQPAIRERLEGLSLEGKVWTNRVVDLEYLYTVPAKDVASVIRGRRLLPQSPVSDDVLDQALEIVGALAEQNLHRGARGMDCAIAASAMASGLTVLHYDRDFDRISQVTGLATEWVAPAGSLDR